jgi:hypothetical protein
MKTILCRKFIPSKMNSTLTGKQCSRCCSFWHTWLSLGKYMCFFCSDEYAYLEQKQSISTLKLLSCRKNSFQKLSQYAWGNKVLDATACKTDGFLSRETCLSSTYLNRPIWNIMSLSPPWKLCL